VNCDFQTYELRMDHFPNAPPQRLLLSSVLLLFLVVHFAIIKINVSEPRFYGHHYRSQSDGSEARSRRSYQ
jgi:hypothetical protein